jgi:hypothetical protein
MWARRAASRRVGRSNLASWVEVIIWPLGFEMLMGFVVRRLLMMGKLMLM